MPEQQRPGRTSAESQTRRDSAEDRYELYGEIASGGMASVEYARLTGPHGFSRACAIKRLHPHFAKDPAFVEMFIDEARLSARLQHANIVSTLDVIAKPGELALVMEYVHGESLSKLLELAREKGICVPVPIATWLLASVAHGLHAAHETCAEDGRPLGVVHRDVSPDNILVGADGVPRVLDFGIAKAAQRLRVTPSGEIKGKLSYIAPEQLEGKPVDRRTDIYGASVVLWETLTGLPLFHGTSESAVIHRVLREPVVPPSRHAPHVPSDLDAIVLRGLQRDPAQRFATALELAIALERVGTAAQSAACEWVKDVAGDSLARRLEVLRRLQTQPIELAPTSRSLSATSGVTRRITDEPDRGPQDRDTTAVRRRVRSRWPWGVVSIVTIAAAAAAWSTRGGESSTGQAPALEKTKETSVSPAARSARDADASTAAGSPAPLQMPEAPREQLAPEPASTSASTSEDRSGSAKPVDVKKPKSPTRRTSLSPPPEAAPRRCPPFVYRDGIRQRNEACLDAPAHR